MSRHAHAQIQIVNLRFKYTALYDSLMTLVRIRPSNKLTLNACGIVMAKMVKVEEEIDRLRVQQRAS